MHRARAQVQQAEAARSGAAAQIRRAEADLTEARRQLTVNERLAKEEILSTDSLDASRSRVRVLEAAIGQANADAERAEASLQQSHADLRYAEALLQNTVIRAPFSGVVVKKMAEVGESVAPIPPGVNLSTSSGAIVALADLDTLEVEADVSESNVAKLSAEQPAEVSVEAFPDRRYKAVLRQIIPTADRTKATVQVKVTILDKDQNLRPEMTARVTFVSPQPAAAAPAAPVRSISVPQDTLVSRDGRSFVYEVHEGRAREREVVLGGTWQGRVIVNEGLAGTETLVVRPPAALHDGDAVRVKG